MNNIFGRYLLYFAFVRSGYALFFGANYLTAFLAVFCFPLSAILWGIRRLSGSVSSCLQPLQCLQLSAAALRVVSPFTALLVRPSTV